MTDPRLVRYAQLICEHSLGIDESHRAAHLDAAAWERPWRSQLRARRGGAARA